MAFKARNGASPADRVACVLVMLALLTRQPAAAGAARVLTVHEEGVVMRRLRQRLADAGLTPDGWHGWHPSDEDAQPHCSWQGVQCSTAGRVISIYLDWETFPPPGDTAQRNAAPLLLPELAHFGALQQLMLNLYYAPPVVAIPQEWGLPGAFPALVGLDITVPTLQGPLPDIRPGALPLLTSLHIEASNRTSLLSSLLKQPRTLASQAQNSSSSRAEVAAPRGKGLRAALPDSWAGPDVLPALEHLTLVLQLVPPLPAAWAHGFRRLRYLRIAAPVDAPLPAAAGNILPPEWAAGFPALRWLSLLRLGLTGSFPAAWAEGGFPKLSQLELPNSALAGPLPERILEAHAGLQILGLELNNFTGALPAAWAASQSLEGLSLQGNRLTGELFPPTWMAPGAMPHLTYLVLDNNAGLAGSLPPKLPWPALTALSIAGTAVQPGAMPASWCSAPNSAVFTIMDANNTAVEPKLPPCAAKAMPSLTLYSQNQSIRSSRAPSAAQHASPRAWAAIAAVPLVLLALAGVAGIAVRRRRQRSRPDGGLTTSDAQVTSLLIDRQTSRLSDGQKPRTASSSCRRSHRIESMLRSQLAQSRIQLVALQHLPAAMVHRVGCKHSPAAAPPALDPMQYSRLQPVDEEQQHNSWGSFSSSGSGDISTGPLEAGTGKPPPASRQWGLGTDSLRLQPGELELVGGPDGTLCLLGEGSTSAVFLGQLSGQVDVAVKVIELAPGMDSWHVWHEVSLLRACVHRRLVGLLGVACQGQLLMLVMELMRGGDLHSALQRPATRDALRWAARGRQVALDVAEALAFLHSCGVQHADLKPSNVMLTCDLRAKLTDLGVAQQLGSRSRQAVGGTTQYAAPEQLLCLPCTTKADVYSLGVLLTVLCTGRPLAARGQLCLPAAPADCPQAVLELIHECICPEPARRPTAKEVLRRLHAA